ncbi:hypothetical protein SSX86_023907 [Deinandra increscens subsp. villosa]|uniref:Uncharacterized protein n=1 Tax=Deinandra increscens subsp. villosa TaxID=3103831 RepID=A0AAP0CH45_9ASTR
MVTNNLPPPSVTAKLLQSTSIGKVRLYVTDPTIIKALGNTDIGIPIGAANGDIPAMAADVSFAKSWIGWAGRLRARTLAFCLFQPNVGRPDSGTNIKYMLT